MLSLPTLDFIPGWLYQLLFDVIILISVMTVVTQSAMGGVYRWNTSPLVHAYGKVLVFFLIIYIGLRPTESPNEYPYFVDTYNYVGAFNRARASIGADWLPEIDTSIEWFWGIIVAFCARYADVHTEFLIAAAFYVGCVACFCTRTFGKHWYIPFLMICAAFTFFAYGVNGIRNGMAASMVILALSYRNKLTIAALLCFMALGVHKSMALTIASALLAWKITNPKIYIAGWLASIMLTAAAGGAIGNMVELLGFFDDRLANYGAQDDSDYGYYTGFRADFLLYSSLPIISGGYFIFKQKYIDPTYLWIYNIYIISNAFWVLMMYASFSNRFAQLSWFIMPIVLVYPWFKKRFWRNQENKLAGFLLVCYAYTFYAHFIRHDIG